MDPKAWSLELVRGREVGRSYPLGPGETVLGNALDGSPGIDLGPQEADSPRRMASRQAVIAAAPSGITIRDVDSPGGTFVNRRRLLPGQSCPLADGDTIQLGPVQLRVVGRNGTRPADSPFSFRLLDGTVCRSWEDFLRVSSQKWEAVRDELTSGRIDAWLRSIGRADLMAGATPGADPDARLDHWLASLPSDPPSRPELDVHPARLVVRVAPGGGETTRTVRVSNVGHRLLQVNASIEPASGWVKLDPLADRLQSVTDSLDLPLTITIPETLPRPLVATLIVGGNGGSKRVEIVLEAKSACPDLGSQVAVRAAPIGSLWTSILRRKWIGAFGLMATRVAVSLGNGLVGEPLAGPPRLVGSVILFAIGGGLAMAVWLGRRRLQDAGFGAVSGAIAGACLAALAVAGSRIVDSTIPSVLSPLVVWMCLGSAIGLLSWFVISQAGGRWAEAPPTTPKPSGPIP